MVRFEWQCHGMENENVKKYVLSRASRVLSFLSCPLTLPLSSLLVSLTHTLSSSLFLYLYLRRCRSCLHSFGLSGNVVASDEIRRRFCADAFRRTTTMFGIFVLLTLLVLLPRLLHTTTLTMPMVMFILCAIVFRFIYFHSSIEIFLSHFLFPECQSGRDAATVYGSHKCIQVYPYSSISSSLLLRWIPHRVDSLFAYARIERTLIVVHLAIQQREKKQNSETYDDDGCNQDDYDFHYCISLFQHVFIFRFYGKSNRLRLACVWVYGTAGNMSSSPPSTYTYLFTYQRAFDIVSKQPTHSVHMHMHWCNECRIPVRHHNFDFKSDRLLLWNRKSLHWIELNVSLPLSRITCT